MVATGGFDGAVCLHAVPDGKELWKQEKTGQPVLFVLFSPNGRHLLSVRGEARQIVPSILGRLKDKSSRSDAKWLPTLINGRLPGEDELTAVLSNVVTGRDIKRFGQEDNIEVATWPDIVGSAAFASNSERVFLTLGHGDEAHVDAYDTKTGEVRFRLNGCVSPILVWPKSKFLFAMQAIPQTSGVAQFWNLDEQKLYKTLAVRLPGDQLSPGIGFADSSPDGRKLLVGYLRGLRAPQSAAIWDVTTPCEPVVLEGNHPSVLSLAFSPDGSRLAIGGATVGIWNLQTGKRDHNVPMHFNYDNRTDLAGSAVGFGGAEAMCFSQDSVSLVLARYYTSEIATIDVNHGNDLHRVNIRYPIMKAVFAPDGRQVAVISFYVPSPSLWESKTGELASRLSDETRGATSIAYAPDGKTIVSAGRSRICVSAVDTGKALRQLGKGGASSILFSCDGRSVLAASLATQKIACLHAETGDTTQEFDGSQGEISCMAISDDGQDLCAGDREGSVCLWDYRTAKLRWRSGRPSPVTALTFPPRRNVASGPGRDLVAVAYADGVVILLAVTSGKEIVEIHKSGQECWAVVAPDGRFDVSDTEKVKGLHWVVPDDPLTPLPIEIFMRDYYEPRLLARILGGEKFKPIRDLQSLNRVQPSVQITKVAPNQGNRTK